MLVDYLHPRKFPVLGKIATWTLRTATVAALVGIYQFNTNDVGTSLSHTCLSKISEYPLLPSFLKGLAEFIARVWTA